ncbi:MAG: coproporphyrinogen III oxidase family protein [Deferribacteres bacterium]|nr:coproporphyrinogen III oxidase family protein [candidate division KSB1 bacterium]MCB9510478.1 coproporphyrinogen III oxidase family protein [Deferribacteres bacterium]
MSQFKKTQAEPATGKQPSKSTEVGSVFVSNYPPYSFWQKDETEKIARLLQQKPSGEQSLGLYMHIPFCRKRCKFCYFKVYTDKNSRDIQGYLDALAREIEMYSEQPAVADRPLKFVYFGGGTPSYISAKHLQTLVDRVNQALPWAGAEEIAFECEPGTLTQTKLEVIKKIGVTRLSLGVENFSDFILQENGRAHVSKEIYRVLPWIKQLGFDQLNIDLIAGMVGETWESWRDGIEKTIDIDPDSVTIYQMELPFNTVYSQSYLHGESEIKIADWDLKRDWHDYAIDRLSEAGYEVSSAYTMVKKDQNVRFVYRDSVWQGWDMLGTGVASFGHLNGSHVQNTANWEQYLRQVDEGTLPLSRSYAATATERLTRETILQLKLGKLNPDYFRSKFGVDILEQFAQPFRELQAEGFLSLSDNAVTLTRTGLLQVDALLPRFYEPKYRNARYT